MKQLMRDIRVCGLKEIAKHADWYTHVISIVDSAEHVPQCWAPQLIELFGDVEPGEEQCSRSSLARSDHIKRMHDFVQNLPENARLLVHCHAGVSRSPATAIAILCAWGWPVEQAVEHIAKIRPVMWPNKWILELWGKELGLPDLAAKTEEWKNQQTKTGIFIPKIS
jgi:predicted protein tyrosine phosphatase